ncbi:TniQ family protein [Pelomonas sp. BJYL3]|uniref:TniQ family protein n=1 Tax=Pelomonas sp. BJYL3 TaxID=2976697 RepID=UPI0022B4DE76|nr:TniQ family protein [Pelomonas sp. BJYL3]
MTTNLRRPRLWHLPPIGVGTPDVESADSYLGRLAQAHGVPRQTLHKFINGHGPAIYQNLRGQPPRLDVPSQQAAAYMRRVADLVGHPEVETLGLSWLADRLRAQHVFRSDRAWCPACLAEMPAGPGLHMPLIWGLASVTHCARHGVRLRTACPACGAKGSIRRVGAIDGASCASCGGTLVAGDGEAAEPMSEVEAAVLAQMGLLVSVVASQAVGSESPSFGEIVTTLHRRGHHVKACEMARRMGISKGTVSTLMSGRTQPGIDLLLRLSTAYAVQLPDLLLRRPGDREWLKRAARHHPVVWPARARPRVDWAASQRVLELEMVSEAALPVAQVAKRLQIDPRHLMTQRPECAAVLSERYQMRIKQERKREGERVLAMVQALDEWPSQRAVARDIGVARTSRGFRGAWQ